MQFSFFGLGKVAQGKEGGGKGGGRGGRKEIS